MIIEFDTETTGLQPYAHEVFLVQFEDESGQRVALRHPEQRDEIQQWLSKDAWFRATNAKFDLHFLENAGYTLPPLSRIIDAQVIFHLLDSNQSTALKKRGAFHLGDAAADNEAEVKAWLAAERRRRKKAEKDEGVPFEEPNYRDVPDEMMIPYALNDVTIQRKLCELYGLMLEREPELKPLYKLERDVTEALYAMERRGMPMDREATERLYAELEPSVKAAIEHCQELVGVEDFNPRSSQQVIEALVARGVPQELFEVRKKNPTTGEYETKLSAAVEVLQSIDDDLARAILAFRGEEKVRSTYVAPMLKKTWKAVHRSWKHPFIVTERGQNGDVTDRIHPSFRQLGARTGRMSCNDPNVQNWPRDDLRLRYLMRAEPGNKLITADLDSIELRLFAAFVGDGDILRAVRDPDADLHTMTAEAAGLTGRQRGGAFESARQQGKTLNYAMIYLGTEWTIKNTFGVSLEEAKEIHRRYHARYPEVREFELNIMARLEEEGYITSPWGRKFRLGPDDTSPQRRKKFVNYLIQGTAADLLKESMVRLHKQGVPLISVVHDELIAEVSETNAEEVAKLIEYELTNHPRITKVVPLGAEAQIIDRWSQAKDPEYVPDYALTEASHG